MSFVVVRTHVIFNGSIDINYLKGEEENEYTFLGGWSTLSTFIKGLSNLSTFLGGWSSLSTFL